MNLFTIIRQVIVSQYVSGICDQMDVTQENMCIIEVGITTHVLVHKTNDREVLLSALGNNESKLNLGKCDALNFLQKLNRFLILKI